MVFDLKNLFSGGSPFNVDYRFAPDKFIFDKCAYIHVKGSFFVRSSVVFLEAVASFDYSGDCDCCLEPISRAYNVPLSHIIVSSLNNDDNGEFIVTQTMSLDLDELALSDILLFLPIRILCREDCSGLCPVCGNKLSGAKCSCGHSEIDPRLLALKELLD